MKSASVPGLFPLLNMRTAGIAIRRLGTGFKRPQPVLLSPAQQKEFEELVKQPQLAMQQPNENGEPAQHPDYVNIKKEFEGNVNPVTGEIGGPQGKEPTRYGDWERNGRVYDF